MSLADLRGKTVLVKFLRFAACPVCNLHLREYVRRYDELAAAGITVLAVFHSPPGKIDKQLRDVDLPFEIIADPEKAAFAAYGVERSLRGMFTRRVMRDYVRAIGAGFLTRPVGHEGGIQGHPADFLVDGEGIIRLARYGRDYADTMQVDDVVEAAVGLGIANPVSRGS
jgi:peroxiredoxin